MMNDAHVGTYPAHGVMQARPATAPVKAPMMLGLPDLHQLMAVHVHMAAEAAMSVFTKACAATALAASAEPALKPNQPNHSKPGSEADEGDVVGEPLLTGSELACPDDPDRREGGETGARVYDEAAGEVEDAPFRKETAAPDPVHDRHVDEEAPKDEELQVALEVHAIGKGAGDERRGDDGEHLLEYEVGEGGDVRRLWFGCTPTPRRKTHEKLPMTPPCCPRKQVSTRLRPR